MAIYLMPHSRSPRTSHGGQTYPEKEKVKPAVSQGHWMTNDLETQVLIPEFSMDPCAFKGTGAQLLPLVSSQGGGQFVLRNMPAVTCSSTGCSTAAQVPTQSLTDQGPGARSGAVISLLDHFRATEGKQDRWGPPVLLHRPFHGSRLKPAEPAQGPRYPPSPLTSACGTYLWVVCAELINCTELDQLLIDAERRIPQGTEQALIPRP